MVESTIRTIDESVSYKDVLATRGKLVRAEPVYALYGDEKHEPKIHHVGVFPELEEEMCSYVPGNKSPNRMDAMVWCFTELLIGSQMLGLVEYFESGRAERDMQDMEKQGVERARTLAKPAKADESSTCPECGSRMIIPVAGGQLHCNECGVQWSPKGSAAPPEPQGARRNLR
jgi:ribosomal protein L37AE/L43A